MPNCHLCNTVMAVGHGRSDPNHLCIYCFKRATTFCDTCAWWELGPVPAPAGLPPELRQPPGTVIVPCRVQDKKREQRLMDAAREKCKHLKKQMEKGQLYGQSFSTIVERALFRFDDLYHRYEGRQDIEHQKMMHTIILVYLSSQLTCQDPTNRYLHRHDAPALSGQHLEACFFDDEFIPAAKRPLAKAAISSLSVERYLRGKINAGLAHLEIKQHYPGKSQAEYEALVTICLQLYHVWMVIRQEDVKPGGNFDPRQAHSYLRQDHRDTLFSGSEPYFTPIIEAKLGALYASFQAHVVPPPIRFPDETVQAQLRETKITPLQAQYLQSLPTMDHTGAYAGASECEQMVRRRVIYRLNEILTAAQIQTKQAQLPRVYAQYLNNPPPTPWNLDALLDALILNLKTQWVSTCCYEGLLGGYAKALKEGTDNDFSLKSFMAGKSVTRNWSQAIPTCPLAGTYIAISHLDEDLKSFTDGRQDAKEGSYPQWRMDKDQRLYGGYQFPFGEVPNLASLSLWQRVPEPAPDKYGHHVIYWNRGVKARSVFTLGDYGAPRRSRLLLLQDMIGGTPRLDGKEYAPVRRYYDLEFGLMQLEAQLTQGANYWDLLRQIQSILVQDPTTLKNKLVGNQTNYEALTLDVECHIFGSLSPSRDAQAILLMSRKEGGINNESLLKTYRDQEGKKPWRLFTYIRPSNSEEDTIKTNRPAPALNPSPGNAGPLSLITKRAPSDNAPY